MASLGGWLNLTRPYVAEYGWLRSLRIGAAIRQARWHSPKGNLVKIAIPRLAGPIHLRAGTSDAAVFHQLFADQHQQIQLGFEPEVILDIGANIGLASVLFARSYPSARIVSVEPDQGNFSILQKNVEPYPNIEAINTAIWCRDTYLRIENPKDKPWAFRVEETTRNGADCFEGISLGTLMERCRLSKVDVLKLDIEGAELEVLGENLDSWIGDVRLILVELHERFRPGCEAVFEQATSDAMRKFNHGEYSVAQFY